MLVQKERVRYAAISSAPGQTGKGLHFVVSQVGKLREHASVEDIHTAVDPVRQFHLLSESDYPPCIVHIHNSIGADHWDCQQGNGWPVAAGQASPGEIRRFQPEAGGWIISPLVTTKGSSPAGARG